MSRIGDRLRTGIPTVRGEQKAVAFRAGVTPETLNKILTGKTREPGFETVAKIARAAGLDLDALAGNGTVPTPRLTPYDTNPAYRTLIDALEILSPDVREPIVRHATWQAVQLAAVSSQPHKPPDGIAAPRHGTGTYAGTSLESVAAKHDAGAVIAAPQPGELRDGQVQERQHRAAPAARQRTPQKAKSKTSRGERA